MSSRETNRRDYNELSTCQHTADNSTCVRQCYNSLFISFKLVKVARSVQVITAIIMPRLPSTETGRRVLKPAKCQAGSLNIKGNLRAELLGFETAAFNEVISSTAHFFIKADKNV